MQTDNRLFDDLARMANGALNTLSGLREEIETRVRERVERILAEMDLVTREEFEATREMAQKARTEQEQLAGKVAELERRIGEQASASKSTTRARQSGASKSAAGSKSGSKSTAKRGAPGRRGAKSEADNPGASSS